MTAGLLKCLLLQEEDVDNFPKWVEGKELWNGLGGPRGVILLFCFNMFWSGQ